MRRFGAVVALAFCLNPTWLRAQTTERFTITADSATVHKGPSTGSPVIGTAPRGTVLEVRRDLGSWVQVSWDAARNGIGYVHESKGSTRQNLQESSRSQRSGVKVDNAAYVRESVRSVACMCRTAATPGTTAVSARIEQPAAIERSAPPQTMYVTAPPHFVGIGGRMNGSTLGFGGTARAWSRKQFGVQFEVSRTEQTSAVPGERLTSLRFAPSAIYSLRDLMSDYVWLRPYVGAGATLRRATLSGTPSGTAGVIGASTTDSSLGFQAFAGAELTFASVPRFAISVDVGYQRARAPFPGFDVDKLGYSVSGHWYVK